MTISSKVFQEHAWVSLQVDEYYAVTRIFARNYEALKVAYDRLPQGKDWPDNPSRLSQAARDFFINAAFALKYMGSTKIFTETPFPALTSLPADMINFGFCTCFCFQWAIFENFVKQGILRLAEDGLLPPRVATELKKRKQRTRDFLVYADSGSVFGHSPFVATLPVIGSTSQNERCNFAELEEIRGQCDRFIQAVDQPSLLPDAKPDKEHYYERSMRILRDFARNGDQDIQNLRMQKEVV